MSDVTGVVRRENIVTTRQAELPKGNTFREFNRCFVSGRIEAEFEYSHDLGGEKFYKTRVIVERTSGKNDFISIIVSDLLIGRKEIKQSFKGKWAEVRGVFRRYKIESKDGLKHSEFLLLAKDINILEDEEERQSENHIYLDGYLIKTPVFRETHASNRQITDLSLEVHRSFGKSDYIPCIVWGRQAKWASEFEIGTRVQLYGRIQSKQKEYGDFCEISVAEIQKVEK